MQSLLSTPQSQFRFRWTGLLAVLTALVPMAPGAEAQVSGQAVGGEVLPLTLEEAVARAQTGNPSLQVSRNQEGPAEWELRSARGGLLPSLSTGFGLTWQGPGDQQLGTVTIGDLGFTDQPSFYFSNYNLGFSLNVSGSTLLAPRRAEANLEATRARIGTAEADLVLEVTRAYLEVHRREEAIRLSRTELARAEANLELAEARVAVGAATVLEERQAEVAVGRARVNLLREEGEARSARVRLFQLMGEDPEGRDLRLTSTFDLEPVEADEDQLYLLSLERNPSLAALRAEEAAAEHGVRSARSTYLPSLSLQGGWSGFTRQASDDGFVLAQARRQAEQQISQCQFQNEIFSRLADPLPPADCGRFEFGPDRRDAVLSGNRAFPFDFTRQPPSLSLSISLPIFQGFQRQHQVETARVARDNVRLQLRERRLAVRADIARGLISVRTAYEAALLEEENRELADRQLELAREQFREGMLSFLELADAESMKAQADREYLAAVHAYHEAITVLEAVVGVSLRTP